MVWVNERGEVLETARCMLMAYTQYLFELPGMSHSVFSTALNWMQWELNTQTTAKNANKHTNYIRRLAHVQEYEKTLQNKLSSVEQTISGTDEVIHRDMHAKLENDMSKYQKLQFVAKCFDKDENGKPIFNGLFALNSVCELLKCDLEACRSEDLR